MTVPAHAGGENGHGSETPSPLRLRLEKIERDCLKLIDCIGEMKRNAEKQSLRSIADRTGLSKDEVNRYLNPEVRELYRYPRLLSVRSNNRRLYNYLIVSGPPKVEEGQWQGILANTSKFPIFAAVAAKFGYAVRFLGDSGVIVDLEYRGIEHIGVERIGKAFSQQEPVLDLGP